MGNVPTGKPRQFKLTDEYVELLDVIAIHRGLLRGGVPSRSEVIRTLLAEERERMRLPISTDAAEAPRG